MHFLGYLELLPAMLTWAIAALAYWSLLTLSLFGLGRIAVFHLVGVDRFNHENFVWTIWAGLLVYLALLQISHFLVPVNFWVAWAPLLVGLAICSWCLVKTRYLNVGWSRGDKLYGLCMLIFGAWLALQTNGALSHYDLSNYDADFYHFGQISWIQDFSIVPGLANLHARFGFNSSNFYFLAALDHIAPQNMFRGYHLGAGFISLLTLATLAIPISERYEEAKTFDFWEVFSLMLLVAFALVAQNAVVSTGADLPVTGPCAILYLLIAKSAQKPKYEYILYAGLLAVLAVTLRTSAIITATFAFLTVVTIVLTKLATPPYRQSILLGPNNVVFRTVVLSGCALIVWGAVSVMLSGYLIFPQTFSQLPVSWAVPHEIAVFYQDLITYHARSWSDQAVAVWDWLGPWLSIRMMVNHPTGLLIPVVWLCAAAILARSKNFYAEDRAVPKAAVFWISAVCVTSIAFWAILAPAPRFANIGLFIPGALTTAVCFYGAKNHKTVTMTVTSAALLGMFMYSVATLLLSAPPIGDAKKLNHFSTELFLTKYGDWMYRPVTGDRCGSSDLPCTPYEIDFRYRDPLDISQGFVHSGELAETYRVDQASGSYPK